MQFIHIADLHANKQRLEQCLDVLHKIKDYIFQNSSEEPPVLLIAGDFWDSTITNTENSGFTQYLEAMKEIADLTKVYMIYGTSGHEANGSLECFKTLGIEVFSDYGFSIGEDKYGKTKYTIFAIPEPRKCRYAAKSTKELDEAILNDLRSNIDNIKLIKDSTPTPINILMYHGEVTGSTYQNGMQVSEHSHALPSAWLKELDLDYIACGHIHTPQQPKDLDNCYYSGSCAPVDAGEHHDAGFYVIDIEVD